MFRHRNESSRRRRTAVMRRDDHPAELRAPDGDALRPEPSKPGCRARSHPRLPLQSRGDSEVAQRSRRLGAEQPQRLGLQDHRSGRFVADAKVFLERCDPPEPGKADAKRPRGAATRTSADRPPSAEATATLSLMVPLFASEDHATARYSPSMPARGVTVRLPPPTRYGAFALLRACGKLQHRPDPPPFFPKYLVNGVVGVHRPVAAT
jgi:hypothetical protein